MQITNKSPTDKSKSLASQDLNADKILFEPYQKADMIKILFYLFKNEYANCLASNYKKVLDSIIKFEMDKVDNIVQQKIDSKIVENKN